MTLPQPQRKPWEEPAIALERLITSYSFGDEPAYPELDQAAEVEDRAEFGPDPAGAEEQG